jgi:hypothetical protein
MPTDRDKTEEQIWTLFDSAKLTIQELARSAGDAQERQELKRQHCFDDGSAWSAAQKLNSQGA